MSELKYNFGHIEGAASASLDDGNVDSFASTSDAGGETAKKLANVWGGSGSDSYQQTQTNWHDDDTFDFKAIEESEAAGTQLGQVKYDDMIIIDPMRDDGTDDLATYQPDTDGGSLATIDVVGVPATLAEYGLLLA